MGNRVGRVLRRPPGVSPGRATTASHSLIWLAFRSSVVRRGFSSTMTQPSCMRSSPSSGVCLEGSMPVESERSLLRHLGERRGAKAHEDVRVDLVVRQWELRAHREALRGPEGVLHPLLRRVAKGISPLTRSVPSVTVSLLPNVLEQYALRTSSSRVIFVLQRPCGESDP